MNKKNKNSIFSLVISILTLAFMTIGTTFAFFTSVVKSDKPIEVEAANYKLTANIEPLYPLDRTKKIIPTNDVDIMTAFENECIDDYNYGACYAYNINIATEGNEQDVIGYLRFDDENLPNLKYMILELDLENSDENDKYSIYKDADETNSDSEAIGEAIHLEAGKTKSFILLVWLSNKKVPQDEEVNQSFTGYFTVTSTMGAQITGSLTASVNNS